MDKDNTLKQGRIDSPLQLSVRNVGGITDADVSVSDGVTLLSGRNASNKSSLLRALAGVLGGPVPPIKSDAQTGSVRLESEDETYELELERRNDTAVATGADVYSSADDLCELFVALTETNPIRQTVLAGGDLYDLLMRPVDTDAIESEIRRLRSEKADLDDRLEELNAMESRLPGLRTRRDNLRQRQAAIESELREKRDAIEELEAASETDDESEELRAKRADRNEVRTRVRTQENAITSLEAELEEVTEQLEELRSDSAEATLEELTDELDQLHQQKQHLTTTINALSPIVEMNTQILDDDADIPEAMQSDDVVAELDPSSRSVTCWTCGSSVERAEIAEQVETIEGIVREKRNQRDTVTGRIQTLTEQRRELEQRREDLERLRASREEIADELEKRRETLTDLKTDLRELEADIEERQREADASRDEEDRLSEYYDEISDLEYERGQVATDLESVNDEIAEIETALAEREDVEARRDSVAAELQEQRERIDSIERNLVSTFNEMMQRVLDTLAYQSVERVWIERRSAGDGPTSETEFELHVVRTSDEGTVYEDTVDSLSKSEREVVGLVVALAGYLVHDVSDEVPFLVVDAVEMFDADRIHGLMDLFGEHAEYVVAAVLPEEANELDGTYETVSTGSVVSTP